MKFWPQHESATGNASAGDQRQVVRVQVMLLFLIGTLLYFGLPGTRQWRADAERANLYTVIRAWDGLSWYVWVAAAPLMMRLIRRFPLVRGQVQRSVLGLLLGSLLSPRLFRMASYLHVQHMLLVTSLGLCFLLARLASADTAGKS